MCRTSLSCTEASRARTDGVPQQYAQADTSETDRIVDAMHKYIKLVHRMLHDNFTGLIPKTGDVFDGSGWGPARAHESKYLFRLFFLLASILSPSNVENFPHFLGW